MILFFVFILGLAIGSFLNVVICRLHSKEAVSRGRSHCPACRHALGALDLIPVFSFVFLRGRCRHCGKKISWQYPAVELSVGILFALAYLRHSPDIFLCVRDWFFISVFVIVFAYDLKHYLISDRIVLPAAAVALAAGLFFKISLWNLLLAGGVAGGFFLLQFLASKGRWIGGGDIMLGFLMGFLLGWPNILIAMFLAYLFGGLTGLVMIFAGKKGMKSELPFGTFLSLASVVTLLYGEEIMKWYLAWAGYL